MFSVYSKNKGIGLTVPILLEGSVYCIYIYIYIYIYILYIYIYTHTQNSENADSAVFKEDACHVFS